MTKQQDLFFFNTQNLTQKNTIKLLIECLKRPISILQLQKIERSYNHQVSDCALWRIASEHKVASVVAEILQTCWPLNTLPSKWQRVYQSTQSKISSYLHELERISTSLEKSGVQFILLENGALACLNPDFPARFNFGDFDILIQPAKMPIVHRILIEEGYIATGGHSTPNAETLYADDGRIIYEMGAARVTEPLRLNIQGTLVARRWLQPNNTPDIETLFGRAIKIQNSSVLVLCPEDFLFQLCIHSAAHGYVRKPGLRLHLDIQWFLQNTEVNWEHFLEMARKYSVQTKVYFSLLIPHELFDTPVPKDVLPQLKPTIWKERILIRLIQKAGLFNISEKKFGRLEFIFFNALLYDDFGGLLRGIFPDANWMQARYQFQNRLLLPYYHIQRIMGLLFRRLAT